MSESDRQFEFSQLLREHFNLLYGYILSMVQDPNDAEDLFQQTSLTLWKKFDQFETDGNFAAWAYTVARYDVLAFLRNRSRERARLSDQAIDTLADSHSAMPVEPASERQDALGKCLKALSAVQRELLDRAYVNRDKVKAIADGLGRTPQSVHSSLKHIRGKLLECIEWRLGDGGDRDD